MLELLFQGVESLEGAGGQELFIPSTNMYFFAAYHVIPPVKLVFQLTKNSRVKGTDLGSHVDPKQFF